MRVVILAVVAGLGALFSDMHSSHIIADIFLQYAREAGSELTPMQVLKLVYIAHGWMLGIFGEPLISDRIGAWDYGPIIPKLYHRLKKYRDHPVTAALSSEPPEQALSDTEIDLIWQIFDNYGHFSGPALSTLTRQKNSPWDITCSSDQPGVEIHNDLLRSYYFGMHTQFINYVS